MSKLVLKLPREGWKDGSSEKKGMVYQTGQTLVQFCAHMVEKLTSTSGPMTVRYVYR